MRKVSFPFTVRHGGVRYTPGTPVEVEEKEINEMLAMGARLLEEKAEEHAAEERAADETVTEEAAETADETAMAEAAEKAAQMTGTGKGAEPAPAEDSNERNEAAEDAVKEETHAELDGQANLFEQVQGKPKTRKKGKA